jgi:hypothetical protein
MIENLILKLDWPNWLFFILLCFVASIAFFYYYRTLPPLSKPRRIVLTALRGVGLMIVLFLFLSPILQIVFRENEKPVIAVLLDNSASMKISDSYGERGDSLKYVLKNISRIVDEDSTEIKPYFFDLTFQTGQNDTLDFQTDGTNLTLALDAVLDTLSGKNLQAIILASDGIYNQGSNPVLFSQNMSMPIYTVMIGDSSMPKDIILKRIQTNQITYVNKELPVEVVFWQNGFDGEKVVVTMIQGKNIIIRKTILFEKSGFEQKVELPFLPKKVGDFNYTIQIQSLPDEVTGKNNSQNIRIRTLKNKLKVLVLSGVPNFDRHFLSYFDDQLDDYQFIFLTERSTGNYYETPFDKVSLDSIDLFILHGFPTSRSNQSQVNKIYQEVKKRKLPLFWMLSKTTHIQELSSFNELLPFNSDSRINPFKNVFVKLTVGGGLHPVMNLEETETANNLIWTELPPLEVYGGINMKQGSQVLLQSGEIKNSRNLQGKELPVLYTYRQSGIKHLVFAASDFGFWHFQLQEDILRDQLMLKFMERSIRWLVNREDINQIQIKPVQPTFNLGEAVMFSGQIYDKFYQPIQDAKVTIEIKNGEKEIREEMNMKGGGFYQHTFGGLPEGEYDYFITAETDRNKIGERRGKFTVEQFFLEFQQTAGNIKLMHQLANRTGGKFYHPAEFIQKFPQTKFESRTQYSTSEHFLWDYIFWLFLLILLFGTEWFLRKRWGLL